MDHIIADNFSLFTNYTKTIQTYCAENEEELKKVTDAIFASHEQVNQKLRAFLAQIKDLEYKLASLQSECSSNFSEMLHHKSRTRETKTNNMVLQSRFHF